MIRSFTSKKHDLSKFVKIRKYIYTHTFKTLTLQFYFLVFLMRKTNFSPNPPLTSPMR